MENALLPRSNASIHFGLPQGEPTHLSHSGKGWDNTAGIMRPQACGDAYATEVSHGDRIFKADEQLNTMLSNS